MKSQEETPELYTLVLLFYEFVLETVKSVLLPLIFLKCTKRCAC